MTWLDFEDLLPSKLLDLLWVLIFGIPICTSQLYVDIAPNFHYNDFPVTSSSNELAGKLRESYGLVANFWPSPRGCHGEIWRARPSRHVKMVCRVGGQVGDKSCRVAVMEIGERHDTTWPTFSVRLAHQPITLDCYHSVISDVTVYKHSTRRVSRRLGLWRVHSYFRLLT